MVQPRTLKLSQVADYIEELYTCYQNCNVAKLVSPKLNLFDAEDNVYTVEVNDKLLTDFQKLRQSPNEDIRKTILALMEYYNDHEALNIILMEDVLETRQSYIKFLSQLASHLKHGQTYYTQIKAKFDNTTTRLGIFCRRNPNSTLNSSFLGSIVASLHMHESAEVLLGDIPMSYLGNRAMLKSLLAQRLPGKRIKIHWSKESVKVFIL